MAQQRSSNGGSSAMDGYKGHRRDARLLAELNDLLQLDRDAVSAYSLAISAIRDRSLREALFTYRADHERHVRDLEALIREYGKVPSQLPHLPTGLLKLSAQAGGTLGGDRGIMLAYRANERQVCLKYGRHAARRHAPEIADVLRRNYLDEKKHYEWAEQELERMGAGPETLIGGITDVFALFHGANADMIEAAQRMGLEMVEQLRRRD